MTTYELLLLWASERGSGSWSDFRDAHDWAFQSSADEQRRPPRAATTAHAYATLGHFEVDWQAGVWATTPPSLTILPRAGAHAVLSGARTGTLLAKMAEIAAAADDLFCDHHSQGWGPDARFVAAENETRVEHLAREIGIEYEPCVSERLAELLPPLDTYLELSTSTPPARGYGVKRFNTTTLRFHSTDDDSKPGLYEYGVNRRSEFRWLDGDGTYYALDRATAIYAELRRCKKSALRYRPDNVNGTLIVPFAAPLPALQARTAAMCCGLMPALQEWKWHYANVPSATAQSIAVSLGQELNA